MLSTRKALYLLVLPVLISLTACEPASNVQVEQKGTVTTPGLEHTIESFSAPDKYGVMCYQSIYSSRNLSCAKVVPAALE